MDSSVLSTAKLELKKAKIAMMMRPDTVFYTTILFSLEQEFTEDIPTLATNGKKLLINPEFFTNYDQDFQLMFLSHEVLHVALDHMHRAQDRDHQLWNIAGDYVINDLLVLAGYPMPEFAAHDATYRDMTTEQVYDLLDQKTGAQKATFMSSMRSNNNGEDIQYPDSSDGSADNVTKEEVAEIVLRAVTQVKAMDKGIGSIPGEAVITLDRVLNPRLPWHTILQNYLLDFSKDDYSFRRPNKRFLPNHYLPTAHTESITNLAIAVDCSGSVTDTEFNIFIGKICEIQQTVNPKKITVVPFDTRIKNVQTLNQGEDALRTLVFNGRGGTNITPVLEWVKDNKPTVALVFTDGHFMQREPLTKDTPILWIINDNADWCTDYGQVIHYET